MSMHVTLNLKDNEVDFSVPKGGKRKHATPILVLESSDNWKYEVFKVNRKMDQDYATAFCKVTSPMTGPRGEYSDTYIDSLVSAGAVITEVGGVQQSVYVRCNSRAIFAKAVHAGVLIRDRQ